MEIYSEINSVKTAEELAVGRSNEAPTKNSN